MVLSAADSSEDNSSEFRRDFNASVYECVRSIPEGKASRICPYEATCGKAKGLPRERGMTAESVRLPNIQQDRSFGEISTHRSTSASGQSRKERQVGWEEVCRCASCAHRSCWMFGSRTDSAVMPLSLGNPFAFPQVASYGQILPGLTGRTRRPMR
jgi:alkylated DNA nucleotide flippase Atl1